MMLGTVSYTDAGTYSVVVSGLCGSPLTTSANLTVSSDPVIARGPNNLTDCPGTSASFSVNATGTGLTYQWYQGRRASWRQTGSTVLLASVSVSEAGTYSGGVRGLAGSQITSTATLTVRSRPRSACRS